MLMHRKHQLIVLCAALAFGEALGALSPACAEAWPVAAGLALLVLLFGYGLSLPGWRIVCVSLLGLVLFYRSTLAQEQLYREKPWLRHARRHQQSLDDSAPPWLAEIRRDVSRRLGLGLDHDRELVSLNRAILLGERNDLPRRTRRMFVDAGTIHVFAISGLHVMIVAWTLVYLLLVCRIPFRAAGLAALPMLWGYVVLIGMPPSAVRAALMASFYFTAPLFWRRPDMLVAWELTFLAVHAVRPENIANVGSLLSFTVMFAILFVARAFRNRPTRVQRLAVALAAWAAGVPIAAHVFGRVTPGGLLANVALLPAAGVTVVTGVLGLVTSYASETAAAHLNNVSALFTRAMTEVSRAVAALPGANFATRPWSYAECALWYAAMFLVLAAFKSRRHPF